MSDSGILYLSLSKASQDYLEAVTGGSPIEFFKNPFVILSSPQRPITFDQVAELGENVMTTFLPVASAALLSPASGHPEFCIMGKTEGVLQQNFPELKGVVPYFVWALDVHRNKPSRRFSVQVTNSLVASKVLLTGQLMWAPLDGNVAATWNEASQHYADNPYA